MALFSLSSLRGQAGRGTGRDEAKEIDYRAEDKMA